MCFSREITRVGLITLVTTAAVTAASPMDEFKRDWKNRQVVLAQSLYTIQYPTVEAISPGVIATRSSGITIANPEKGTYYYARPNGNQIADPDPDRLVSRVAVIASNQKTQSYFGKNKQNVTAPAAVLLTYKAGTSMTVVNVFARDQWVRLDLNDNYHRGGPNTTSLLVEWPKKVSKEFNERPAMEKLIATFLKVQRTQDEPRPPLNTFARW